MLAVLPDHIQTGLTICVDSPDGKVFVHCDESAEGKLVRVMINIGKAGSAIHSWADALGRMITGMLESRDILDIISELSNLSTAKSVRNMRGFNVRSGPDAVFYALLLYVNEKRFSSSPSITVSTYRPPMGRIPKNW